MYHPFDPETQGHGVSFVTMRVNGWCQSDASEVYGPHGPSKFNEKRQGRLSHEIRQCAAFSPFPPLSEINLPRIFLTQIQFQSCLTRRMCRGCCVMLGEKFRVVRQVHSIHAMARRYSPSIRFVSLRKRRWAGGSSVSMCGDLR
eukprot:scaffold75198_cov55-Attheya_sp.AAC.3